VVLHASKGGKAGSSKGSQQQQQQPPAGDDWEDEDDAGVILLDDADEEYEEEGGDDFFDIDDEGEEDADLAALGIDLSEADVGPGLITASVPWGETALAVAQQVLQLPQLQGVQLYRFQVHDAAKRVEVRLDRLDDVYGSPSIDDIEVFSRQFLAGLEVQMGPEASGEVSLEVSSPGAERQLVLPGDLTRFRSLPLRVEYHPSSWGQWEQQGDRTTTEVLQMLELDEAAGSSVWALADVKANAPTKGRGMSKKQKQQRFTIPLADMVRVRIHVDF
jgi:ribosome maturation factor RimP